MSENVVTTDIVPIAGGIVATILFGSSYPAVRDARQRGDIGALNPLPFVFIVANCVSWVNYSFLINDWYLYVPNTVGFLLGLFFFLVSYGLIQNQGQRDRLTIVAMVLALLLPIVSGIERLVLADEDDGKLLWGYTANAILLCFYSSPLTTMAHVLRTRDSSSLTLPLSVMNVINGSLWFVYGLVIGDPFIWLPNGAGAVLGLLQTALCIIFPGEARRMQKLQSQMALQQCVDATSTDDEDAHHMHGAIVSDGISNIRAASGHTVEL